MEAAAQKRFEFADASAVAPLKTGATFPMTLANHP